MKTWAVNILTAIVFILVGWFAHVAWNLPRNQSPVAIIKPHPMEKYTIENLISKYASLEPVKISIGNELEKSSAVPKTGVDFKSHEFTYVIDPTLSGGPKKTISGLINSPNADGKFPLIVMFRGYVDQKKYFIGDGTQHAAEFFASKGYITIAPDFLGYGDSDSEAPDIFESRFQTYTSAVVLIKSLNSIEKWDGKNIFIWAHSNGGQVALTSLEITGGTYPTVLWAPNSAKFPYSIIYYLDDADDQGKLIITKLAEFMADYDVTKYAFNNYLDKINAPIEIDQGTADDSVPILWNENLTKNLKTASVEATLIQYPGADHNLQPGWNDAIFNDLNFFNQHLAK